LQSSAGTLTIEEVEETGWLATAKNTLWTTAILEAGRRSLDSGGRPILIQHVLERDLDDGGTEAPPLQRAAPVGFEIM